MAEDLRMTGRFFSVRARTSSPAECPEHLVSSSPARASQPALNSKTVPEPDKGVLQTYVVGAKALSGT